MRACGGCGGTCLESLEYSLKRGMELGRVVAPDPLTEVALADEAVLDPLVVERDDTLHHVGQPLRIDDDQILQRSERIVKVHQAAHVLDTPHAGSQFELTGRNRGAVEEG